MKRFSVFLVSALFVVGIPGGASADPYVGAAVSRGADVFRVIEHKKLLTIQYLGVQERIDSKRGEFKTSADYIEIDCHRTNRFISCKFTKRIRLKVDAFEIDPLLESAHLVAHSKAGKVNVTWTGKGDRDPDVGQHLAEFLYPPYFGYVHASAGAGFDRRATKTGKILGSPMKGSQAWLWSSAGAGVRSCIEVGTSCLPLK